MAERSRKPNSPRDPNVKRADRIVKSASKTKSRRVKSLETPAHAPDTSKQDRCLDLLARRDGADLSELVAVTEWQAHSVRGFLSGVVKKRLGLTLQVLTDENGPRRYKIDRDGKGRR